MRRLLVVADDLGLTPGVNAGIAAAFRDGILTSASWLANTSHFDATAALLRSLPGLQVGIHLTLVGGRPVLDAAKVPSLAPDGARFRESWREFLPPWLLGRIAPAEVGAEWEAQIARAVSAGVRPSHLDSHQHLHLLPSLGRLTADLARRFGIPRIRLPRPGAGASTGAPFSRRFLAFVLAHLAGASRVAPPAGDDRRSGSPAAWCDRLFGIEQTGRLDLAALLGVLRRVPEGFSELVTHPGHPDEELRRDYRWGYAWEAETAALTSPEARREVARLGIHLERP